MATVKLDPAKGVQIPNLTTTERNAISSPETGALIWNTTTSAINQYNGSAWEITYTDTNTQVAGITSSADATAITIDSSENVGIGVTPESGWDSKFTVLEIAPKGIITSSDAATDDVSYGYNWYENGGTAKYKESDYASIIEMRAGNQNFKVAASGSADAAISWTTGFEVLNDGKARAKNGLLFGTDTAAANTLHDYEEGTWSPNYSGNIAFSTELNFRYVKIGSIVKITGYVNGASGTFGTSWSVSGLPYTSNAAYNLAPLWSHGQDQDYMMYMNNGESIMNIRDRDDANMDNTAQISFDCVYMTNQ